MLNYLSVQGLVKVTNQSNNGNGAVSQSGVKSKKEQKPKRNLGLLALMIDNFNKSSHLTQKMIIEYNPNIYNALVLNNKWPVYAF